MSIALLFNGLMMVPQNLLLKEKNFKVVNMIQISGSLINGFVSMILAYLGYSYYALIIGNIARALLQFIMYYLKTDLYFHYKVSFGSLKNIWFC